MGSLVEALEAGDVDPDVRNFNYLVRAMGAQGRFEDAVGMLSRMEGAGVEPNEATYNALIAACAEQRNPSAAWEVAAVMQERGGCCVLRAACCMLRAACCVLRAACCVRCPYKDVITSRPELGAPSTHTP